jgi:hypothetical protein
VQAPSQFAQTVAAPARAARLRPNPFAQVSVRREAGRPVELRIWCVTKSRGAVTRNFVAGRDAEFDRVCRATAGADAAAARPLADLVLLATLGLWAHEDDLIDPVRFRATLEPRRDAEAAPMAADAFALRGEIWLQHGAEPPAHLADAPLGCLDPARPILWHRGSRGEPTLPWWPSAECLAALAALQGGPTRRDEFMPALRALAEQGIVTGASDAEAGAAGLAVLDERRDVFARHGFAQVPGVLPRGQRAAWRGYWQQLAALDVLPDRGEAGARRGSHGEPSSALLLHLMQPLVERVVGAALRPSYSYAWVYRRGAQMPRHRDRDACCATVSLLVDYAPAVDGPTPWPLGIHPRGGSEPVEIRQAIGDAVIFNGRELHHFRPPFTAGTQSISLLLHYVDRDFSGALI